MPKGTSDSNLMFQGGNRMNTIKTGLLLGALTGLLMLIGGSFGGQQGVVITFIFAMVMNFGSYWFSDKNCPPHV